MHQPLFVGPPLQHCARHTTRIVAYQTIKHNVVSLSSLFWTSICQTFECATEHRTLKPLQFSSSLKLITSHLWFGPFVGSQKGGFPKGWFWRMFPRNENWNEGTFGCSPGTKTGTRVSSHVPPERKPEQGHISQTTLLRNRPFVCQ